MPTFQLQAHPLFPSSRTEAVEVHLERRAADRLWLRYMIWAPLEALVIPGPAEAERADNLWATTCLELFAREGETDGYVEFNFSPSTQWAAYRFSSYRAGQTALFVAEAPKVELSMASDLLDAEIVLNLDLGDLTALSMTAVVEETDGTKSFWAPAHPPGRPDFHDPSCFTIQLPPAPAA